MFHLSSFNMLIERIDSKTRLNTHRNVCFFGCILFGCVLDGMFDDQNNNNNGLVFVFVCIIMYEYKDPKRAEHRTYILK